MTKKEARDYVRRWRLAKQCGAMELRRMSIKKKLELMDECYRMAVGLGVLPKYAAEQRRSEVEVADRWRRLKSLPG